LCLQRLMMELRTSELRVMLLQVIISGIINNPILVMQTLEGMKTENYPNGFTGEFLSQWLKDTDCFLGLHDRKVFVLGICSLLSMPPESRPEALGTHAPMFLPALLMIFNGLQSTYEKLESEVEAEEANGDVEELNDSDDEYDEEGAEYLEYLKKKETGGKAYDIDDEDWGNELDMFVTPLDDNPNVDEYISFKNTFEALQNKDMNLFTHITQNLNDEQKQGVQEVINHALVKLKKMESLKLEAEGGFKFQMTNIPTNIQFGGSLS